MKKSVRLVLKDVINRRFEFIYITNAVFVIKGVITFKNLILESLKMQLFTNYRLNVDNNYDPAQNDVVAYVLFEQ